MINAAHHTDLHSDTSWGEYRTLRRVANLEGKCLTLLPRVLLSSFSSFTPGGGVVTQPLRQTMARTEIFS